MSVQASDDRAAQGQEEKKERAEKIDFKMVTFALAGKEYGIDIMNVKEIAHAGRFTYVPNAAPFVRGVYNLRGDIISIIDLRVMFHLPAERKEDNAQESLLILQIGDHVFGVVVDSIDKVVGVARSSVQPPHPIFSDINIRYIKGVIENRDKLYIILNVEKLFAPAKEEDESRDAPIRPTQGRQAGVQEPAPAETRKPSADVNVDFVREALWTLRRFGVTPVNEPWFKARYDAWKRERSSGDIQLKDEGDADQFLSGFYSPHTGELWSDDYADRVHAALPVIQARGINVWNPGCGKGYETYSLACLLKAKYPECRVKIWANDSDLLAISMAPNMVFMIEDVPERYHEFMVEGRNGWTFQQAIRDSIFFEFHDVLNANPVPPVDMILCRDTVSFMTEAEQKRILADFGEKAKEGAALILGARERMPLDGWNDAGKDGVSLFVKTSR